MALIMDTNNSGRYQYLYGPVPSRRLGRSLGVDTVPYKTCSYDCTYCTLGRTTQLTSTREKLIEADVIVREIGAWLKSGGTADYITFAGSGEPTLNLELGDMMAATKRLTDIPLALITNGSILNDPEVRKAVLSADVLLPSLDAATEEAFVELNRPAKGINFTEMKNGLVETSKEFTGKTWLEVMLVLGINDSDFELQALGDTVKQMQVDKLQINTVDRPSRSGDVKRVSVETLLKARDIFGETAEVIVGSESTEKQISQWQEIEDELLQMLCRRPCTVDDIVASSGRNIHEITKYLRNLEKKGLIEQVDGVSPFYRNTNK